MINSRTDIVKDYELVIIYENTCAHVSIITRHSSSVFFRQFNSGVCIGGYLVETKILNGHILTSGGG